MQATISNKIIEEPDPQLTAHRCSPSALEEAKAQSLDALLPSSLLENLPEAVVAQSLDGVIASWNPAAERLFGYSAQEIKGKPFSILLPSEFARELPGLLEKIRRNQRIEEFDTTRVRKDGSRADASLSLVPIKDIEDRVIGAIGIVRDITLRKKVEAELRASEKQFQRAQKLEAVGRLVGGVAHDFNNLLTVISGYSEILLETVPEGSPARELITEIKKAGERAAALTRRLLAFSRNQTLEPTVLDLNAMVTDSEKMLKRLVGDDIDLVAFLDPALGRVKTDLGQIEQVLMNLVINARDAMPQGGKLTIETANAVLDQTYCRFHEGVKPGRYIMLAVSDTGCGMDEQTKASIFEPFFTTKDPGKGTGLGLAMIHGFIKRCGGHVYVYSEPGLGSTFKIYLQEIQASPLSGNLPLAIEKMPHGVETILLAEDEGGVRALTRHILQTCGYTVLEAAHGGEAIRLVEEHQGPIHLLVSDVVMPGMGGRRLAERVVALKPGIKVLYLSGYTDDAVIRHGVLDPGTAFLQKPFAPSALALKVRDVLDRVGP